MSLRRLFSQNRISVVLLQEATGVQYSVVVVSEDGKVAYHAKGRASNVENALNKAYEAAEGELSALSRYT